MKIKCEVCHEVGYLQQLGNYFRVRHYSGIDPNTEKSKFHYHKQSKEYAEAQLAGIEKGENLNQKSNAIEQLNNHEHLNLSNSSLISSGRSLVWLGHQPPTLSNEVESIEHLEHFDLEKYRVFLFSKYSQQYARLQLSYVVRFSGILENPNLLNDVAVSIKSNVLKSIINLAKYLGRYETFKKQLKQHGIKWESGDTSFNAFLNIIDNEHSSLGEWYFKAKEVLPENYRLLLKFALVTGARKWESFTGYNLIIKLSKEGKLNSFYNEELNLLEWFKVTEEDKHIFLRGSKNIYISAVPKSLITEIANSQPVYYTTLRKKLAKAKLKIRVKELRSYTASYLRNNGILAELVDLLEGRMPKSVFARHYLKVKDLKKLVTKVLATIAGIEDSLKE